MQWLTICNPNPSLGPVTCNVVLTEDRADEEAWLFEARLKIYWSGIPVGREPHDYLVAGTREHCEQVRLSTTGSTLWSKQRETPPTDPCTGPFYFKRLPTEAGSVAKTMINHDERGIVMLNNAEDIDAAIKRLKSKRPIDASFEADIRTAFREQLKEGTTKNYLGHDVPTPRPGA